MTARCSDRCVVSPHARQASTCTMAAPNAPHRSLRVGVLILDHYPFADPFQIFKDLLHEPSDAVQLHLEAINVCDGVFPSDAHAFHAFILTGSRADAHIDNQWSVPLKRFCVEAHSRGQLLMGVCYGHQLLSNVFGGRSAPAPVEVGWELGVRAIQPTSAFYEFFPSASTVLPRIGHDPASPFSFNMLEIHRDQVLDLPPSAQLLASSARCPFEMYAIGTNVLCMQGHPEFDARAVSTAADQAAAAGTVDAATHRAAIAELTELRVERTPLQVLIKEFLKQPIAESTQSSA